MKKFISLFLCVIMTMSLVILPAYAEGVSSLESFSVVAVDGNENTKVKLFKNNGEYFLFLPSNADATSLTVYFDGSVKVNGESLISGEETDVFSNKGNMKIEADGSSYTLHILKSENLPSVHISTESGSLEYLHQSKENKESGKITIVNDGNVVLDSALKQIKGRGNSTWNEPKKPYNIKFDKATSILGMEKAKKWSLLANYADDSLMRNTVALSMGDIYGMPYTSERRSVDLYINDEYQGNYLITESVEVGTTRVNVTDLDKANEKANPDFDFDNATQGGTGIDNTPEWGGIKGSRKWMNIPNNPKDIKGGYLMELDMTYRYDGEMCGFCTNQGQTVVLKSPELATKDEVNYIADLFQEAEDALVSPTGYNDKNKHYSEYFDVESLAKLYIIEEFAMEVDAGLSSIYFYKPEGEEKIYAGPLWDFDHAFANPVDTERWGVDLKNTNVWLINQTYLLWYAYMVPTVFTNAYMHEDFRKVVSDIWAEKSDEFTNSYSATIKDMGNNMAASAVMDEFRWNKKTLNSTEELKLNAYKAEVNSLANSFTNRSKALNKGFGEDAAMLYYNSNGGDGYAINQTIASKGENVLVTGSQFMVKQGSIFLGWNTKADGSGKTYLPGTLIKLNDTTTVLYAQWSNNNDDGNDDEPQLSTWQKFINKIADFFARIGAFFRRIFG